MSDQKINHIKLQLKIKGEKFYFNSNGLRSYWQQSGNLP